MLLRARIKPCCDAVSLLWNGAYIEVYVKIKWGNPGAQALPNEGFSLCCCAVLEHGVDVNKLVFVCVCVGGRGFCLFYVCIPHVCSAWRGQKRALVRSLWDWNYRWLWAAMRVLGIEPRSLEEQPVTLNCWTISPAQRRCFENLVTFKKIPHPFFHQLLGSVLLSGKYLLPSRVFRTALRWTRV